jgi:SulP family sulfate permease
MLALSAIMGLYTIVPPLVAYALLGTSHLLVVGPDTATGLISALTVGAVAAQGTADFNTLTSTLAVLIGAFFLLFGALRMGWVAAFIPTPVMRGFIEGLVCVTIIGQVPHLLGISGTSGNFFMKLGFLLQHLHDASLAPVLTGSLSLVAMLLLRRLAPRLPLGAGRRGRRHGARQPLRRRGRRHKRGRPAPIRPASPRSAQA